MARSMQRPMELVWSPCINNFKHFLIFLINSTKTLCNSLFGPIHCFINITYWWVFSPIHQPKHFCQRATNCNCSNNIIPKVDRNNKIGNFFPKSFICKFTTSVSKLRRLLQILSWSVSPNFFPWWIFSSSLTTMDFD